MMWCLGLCLLSLCVQSEPEPSDAVAVSGGPLHKVGFQLLPTDSDRVMKDASSQRIASAAAEQGKFFLAFLKWAQSQVKMPDDAKQTQMDQFATRALVEYTKAYDFSVDFAKALRDLGAFPGNLELLHTLASNRHKLKHTKALTQAKIEDVLNPNGFSVAVSILVDGPGAHIRRATEVLEEAMSLRAQGEEWEGELLEQVKLAKELRQHDALVDESLAAVTVLKGDWAKDQASLSHLEARKQNLQDEIKKRNTRRKEEFQQANATFWQDRAAYRQVLKKNSDSWQSAHDGEIQLLTTTIALYTRKISECEAQKSCHNFERVVEGKTTFQPRDLNDAKGQLNGMQQKLTLLKRETNPHFQRLQDATSQKDSPPTEDVSETWLDADLKTVEEKVLDAKKAVAASQAKLPAAETKLQAVRSARQSVEDKHAGAITRVQKKLGTNSATLADKIVEAYRSSLDFATAQQGLEFENKMVSNEMTELGKRVGFLIDEVIDMETLDDQVQMMGLLRKVVGGTTEDCEESALVMQWLRRSAGLFKPIPQAQLDVDHDSRTVGKLEMSPQPPRTEL